MIIEHAHVVCGAETTAAFLTGLGGHFVFDAFLILLGAFGFPRLKALFSCKHSCEHG
jgi:hypothetical protein